MLEDHFSIDTPEGLRLDLVLAGVGTRIVAAIVDTVVIGALMMAIALGTAFLFPVLEGMAEGGLAFFAVMIALVTAIPLAYYVLFETFDGGRSPGKRMMKMRVVQSNGLPVGFAGSLIRNLLRIVDILPGAYLVGLVTVVASPTNQRVGDLAANTLVIDDRPPGTDRTWVPPAEMTGPRWDVSRVEAAHLDAIRYFMERRPNLTSTQEAQFAKQIADTIRPLVGTRGEHRPDVEFLEKVWLSKEARY